MGLQKGNDRKVIRSIFKKRPLLRPFLFAHQTVVMRIFSAQNITKTSTNGILNQLNVYEIQKGRTSLLNARPFLILAFE
jgi:hypothetical protein